MLCLGAALAVAAGRLEGYPAAYLSIDPQLGHLLRGMALIKWALALAALGVLWWRVGRPIAGRVGAAYLAGLWAMAGAGMVVWQLSHVALGAVLFHAGELTLLFVAWLEHRGETLARRAMT